MTLQLTHAEREQLEQRLYERRSALDARRQAQFAGATRAEHAREVLLQDGDDAPQRDADREIDLATTDLEVVERAAIEGALQRLAEGSYGICGDCGAGIPLARLQLEPHALRCVGCETERERGRPRAASL